MTDKTETPPTNDGEQKTKPSREQIVTELENIFSKEFLSTNPLLVANMKGDSQIPINLLADLPAIKQLSIDASEILDALRSSSKIIVDNDGQFARPVGKLVERNTIILRDVDPETKPEDVRALFGNQEKFLSAILELKPELANTYFIKFNGEDVTLEAWTHLREQNLNGKPVQARVKSENLLKSFYNPAPKPEAAPQLSDFPARNDQPQGYWSYEQQQYHEYVPGEQPFVRGGGETRRGRGGRGEGRGDGRRRKEFRGNNSYDESSRGRGRRGPRDKRSPTKTPPKTEAKKPTTNNNPLPVYWPPLPSSNQTNPKGYHISLKKYPPETITSIISGLKEEIKTKFDNQCSAIMENGFNNTLEITKPLPPNLQVDWIPPKNKSRKSSVSRPKKASFSKKNEKNEPQPNAWPAVNNSNVRHPPNNNNQQQPKGGKAKQPANKKQNQNKPTPTPQDQPTQQADSNASESQVQQTPQQNSNQSPSGNLNPASPSYADITKSVKNEAN